ncbi:hypothetical protein [Telluribacter humicola]|uniref:hypothetical protein n=1 Tax=Telluribacter humicola TaxID=1720261 RepID=UPI001A964C68|nr:hypothetical protein [Telluribacter humicola]
MKRVSQIALLVFLVSFIARVIIINFTPSSNSFADISCLVNGGQMISHGINPYDFEDNVELREKLRLDEFGDNYWLCSNQDNWNYHSANNLPFNLLFNGFLDFFFEGNVYYYRYAYAFLDSCIGYITTLFFFQLISLPINIFSIAFVLLVSSLSPALLLNGTFIPEDKGFQVLLILLSLWFSIHRKFFWACIFLSFSIGFKAIGALIAPICLAYYVLGKDNFLKVREWQTLVKELFTPTSSLKKTVLFTVVTVALFLVIYLPFASDFSRIINQRILYDIDNAPNHSSLWIIFYRTFPESWQTIRTTILCLITLVLLIAFLKNLLPADIFLLSILLLFLCVALLTGSLDRNNMAMQPVIVYMAMRWKKEGMILGWYYGIAGILMLIPVAYKHFIDDTIEYAFFSSLFVLGYCIVFYYIVIRKAFQLWILKKGVIA